MGGREYGKIGDVPASANIHMIVGEDSYLVEAAARKILEAAVPSSIRETAVEIVDGNASNAETQLASLRACVASVMTPPWFDPVKLTWWRGVTFFPGGENAPSEAVKTALEKFVSDLTATPLPENQVLIVTVPKLLRTGVAAKRLAGLAQCQEFADGGGKARDRMDAARMRLPGLAAAEKLTFAPGADEAFLSKVGTDTRIVVSELAKMRTYLGDGRNEVTAADVALVSSVGGEEPELWDVTDAIAQRNPAKLIATLSRFDGEKGFGIMLSTIVEKFFRELVIYRDALDRGWLAPYGGWAKNLPADVQEDLDAAGIGPGVSKGSWAVRRGARNAQAFTLLELRTARYRILQVREKLVSSAADDDLLRQELLRIIARPRR